MPPNIVKHDTDEEEEDNENEEDEQPSPPAEEKGVAAHQQFPLTRVPDQSGG